MRHPKLVLSATATTHIRRRPSVKFAPPNPKKKMRFTSPFVLCALFAMTSMTLALPLVEQGDVLYAFFFSFFFFCPG